MRNVYQYIYIIQSKCLLKEALGMQDMHKMSCIFIKLTKLQYTMLMVIIRHTKIKLKYENFNTKSISALGVQW